MDALAAKAKDIVIDEVGVSFLAQVLERLASKGVLLPSEVPLVLAIWFNVHTFITCLAWLAAPGLNDMLSSLIQSRQTQIQLIFGDAKLDRRYTTVEEFQETYVKRRIATHAKRVAAHQLAAERFVIDDIEEAMREVWKGLPSGFGPVELAPVDEVVEATEDACYD
ncbi:hypothetical protein FRC12_001380 [Ceratobasidium sp. 428]|nr:hypothetical protein FRC12_001380 [Ceratobasidium sp. 428]